MDWPAILTAQYPSHPRLGASEEEIRAMVSTLGTPLSAAEISQISASQRNPFPSDHPLYAAYKPLNPSCWRLPDKPLPNSYLDFLRWSNGGEYTHGARRFQFFSSKELRSYLLSYYIPQYMEMTVPFALNGSGIFYLFNMHADSDNGEYPIVVSSAENLDFDDAKVIAKSFDECCLGDTPIESLL